MGVRRENIIALSNSGTGKSHIALSLGLAACQKGFSVAFTTAAALVHQLMEARDEKRLISLQRELQADRLLIIGELDCVPQSPLRGVRRAGNVAGDHRLPGHCRGFS